MMGRGGLEGLRLRHHSGAFQMVSGMFQRVSGPFQWISMGSRSVPGVFQRIIGGFREFNVRSNGITRNSRSFQGILGAFRGIQRFYRFSRGFRGVTGEFQVCSM